MILTCNKCQAKGINRTEIPKLWDCGVCRDLNQDHRCMTCGAVTEKPFKYCSIKCTDISYNRTLKD
jgi:DNA-directed RNA polymerase subunit RPC12/RpoP